MKKFLLKTLHELRHLTTESGSAASTHAYEKETGWRVSDPRTVEFAEPLVAADGWAWLNAWWWACKPNVDLNSLAHSVSLSTSSMGWTTSTVLQTQVKDFQCYSFPFASRSNVTLLQLALASWSWWATVLSESLRLVLLLWRPPVLSAEVWSIRDQIRN